MGEEALEEEAEGEEEDLEVADPLEDIETHRLVKGIMKEYRLALVITAGKQDI